MQLKKGLGKFNINRTQQNIWRNGTVTQNYKSLNGTSIS